MLQAKLKYAWRWFATAFSFFMFGLGGLLIPLFAVPVLYLLPGDKLKREQRGQLLIHHSFRCFIEMMRFMGVLTYQIEGVEKLNDAELVLANHPTLLDVVFLLSLVPNGNCVVKSKLIRNPAMIGPLKLAGYIVNNESASDVLTLTAEAFKKGNVLLVFPEGTRTTPSEAIRLRRGAANLAIRTGVNITPVLIECAPSTLTKEDRWYQIPYKRMHFRIQVKDKIMLEEYLKSTNPSKSARQLNRDLTEYFNRELAQHE